MTARRKGRKRARDRVVRLPRRFKSNHAPSPSRKRPPIAAQNRRTVLPHSPRSGGASLLACW